MRDGPAGLNPKGDVPASIRVKHDRQVSRFVVCGMFVVGLPVKSKSMQAQRTNSAKIHYFLAFRASDTVRIGERHVIRVHRQFLVAAVEDDVKAPATKEPEPAVCPFPQADKSPPGGNKQTMPSG